MSGPAGTAGAPGTTEGARTSTPGDTAEAEYLASPRAVQDLRAINARFIHHFVTNDVVAHDALLHPDFVTIQGDGARLDRATYLAQWATGFSADRIPYWDTRDEQITVVGGVALVRATNRYVLATPGGATAARVEVSTYTDTYVRHDGAWFCVQAQVTPVREEHQPGDDTVVSVYLHGEKQDLSGRRPDHPDRVG